MRLSWWRMVWEPAGGMLGRTHVRLDSGDQISDSGLVAFIHAVRFAAMQAVGLNGVSQRCRQRGRAAQ